MPSSSVPLLGGRTLLKSGGDSGAQVKPHAEARIRFLVGIGGYYDARAVLTFVTTGHYREPGETGWRTARPHPATKWIFLASNTGALGDAGDRRALAAIAGRRLRTAEAPVDGLARRLGPEGRSLYDLLTNAKPERVEELLGRLPAPVRRHMDMLSPKSHDLSHLAGKLILIHGRADTLIPYSESLSLAAAVPGTELFLIDGFSHIDPAGLGIVGRLQLVDAIQAVLKRRAPALP